MRQEKRGKRRKKTGGNNLRGGTGGGGGGGGGDRGLRTAQFWDKRGGQGAAHGEGDG